MFIGTRITSLRRLKLPSRRRRVPLLRVEADLGFRGKILGVEASIPKNWYKAGETIPISLTFTPTGYKKVLGSPEKC